MNCIKDQPRAEQHAADQQRQQRERQRLEQIPDLVRQEAYDNVLVQRILQEYACGNIITVEECLCRIILELSRNWQAEQRNAYELLRSGAVKIGL